ncbi:MAG: sensor histidine kinase, partial [Desulfobacterales bacterium]|nr:sensor histidine kinase [Desulfobacterales bacterium]
MVIDAECVHSALINILENAIDACMMDATKNNHTITFSTRGEPDHILFEIRDNGVGMDAAAMEKIFNLFFSSKGSKGAGFGLFIAHNLIRRHDGAITVKSAPGQGARFYVKLPRT